MLESKNSEFRVSTLLNIAETCGRAAADEAWNNSDINISDIPTSDEAAMKEIKNLGIDKTITWCPYDGSARTSDDIQKALSVFSLDASATLINKADAAYENGINSQRKLIVSLKDS